MKLASVGLDVTEISRFRSLLRKKQERFLQNTFSERERAFCFSYRDPAPHFAGTFAAKESVQKTLSKPLPMQLIEIRRQKNGKPEVWLSGRKSRTISLSITHSDTVACAVAIRQ